MTTKGPPLLGVDIFGEEVRAVEPLRRKYVVPPFTILDAASGLWQERKDAWLRLGIQSEIGRDAKAYNIHAWLKEKDIHRAPDAGGGTSIFDPVLCECVYRWWSPDGGQVVDPFAGGSVRGIVAGSLNRNYWGCDLRAEQIAANDIQAKHIEMAKTPVWVCGDSREKLAEAPKADLLFSCPPYGDLEKYSDDPRDISNMPFSDFVTAYQDIIAKACECLKSDRFAVFVVGDFRDKAGHLKNFTGGTVACFRRCGLELYNELILATPTGSAALRVQRAFDASRKCAKTHQNVYVFVKGSAKAAAEHLNNSEKS